MFSKTWSLVARRSACVGATILTESSSPEKTGTTQKSADGWFIAMNPDLVVGAWVGFNDRRLTFRSNYWGQGAHTGLFLVGGFLEKLQQEGPSELRIDPERRFQPPANYAPPSRMGYEGGDGVLDRDSIGGRPAGDLLRRWEERRRTERRAGRIGW